MSWFKKKEGEALLPDLPESSVEMPVLPESSTEIPALPEPGNQTTPTEPNLLPAIPNNQDEIKQVVRNDQMQKSSFEPLPTSGQAMAPRSVIMGPPPVGDVLQNKTKGFSKSSIRKDEPIYIRLDKFKEGLEAFEDIRKKIREIEELLGNVKELKQKEENELLEWEREIQIVKSRIETIDNDVFHKLD